jgi:hypothetical protein
MDRMRDRELAGVDDGPVFTAVVHPHVDIATSARAWTSYSCSLVSRSRIATSGFAAIDPG